MKSTIKIAVSRTTTNHVEREIDFPDTAKYYKKYDDGNFFPRGMILFAIIPRFESGKSFLLLEVERNKQDYNDFVPSDDCKSEFWLKSGSIRHQAFDIITNTSYHDGFHEITEEEFEKTRMELLNNYKNND